MDGYRDSSGVFASADAEIACVGDDLPDIPIMRAAGLAVAVAERAAGGQGHRALRHGAEGGRGGAREFCEWLLKAAGKWDAIMERYLPDEGARDAHT